MAMLGQVTPSRLGGGEILERAAAVARLVGGSKENPKHEGRVAEGRHHEEGRPA